MVKVPFHLFSKIVPKRVLVMGDLILDTYTYGTMSRISPEAPVPILNANSEGSKLGGAANVALNLKVLSMDVQVIGSIGKDIEGEAIKTLLKENEIKKDRLLIREVPTTKKNRLIVQGQQVLRIDREEVIPLTYQEEEMVIQVFAQSLSHTDLVVFSDYAKGFLTPRVLKECLDLCNAKGILSIVDPKGDDFTKYKGCHLIKPNEKESFLASKMNLETPIEQVAKMILEKTEAAHLLITRASKGISVFNEHGQRDFASKVLEVKDVTGAGDTVCSMIAFSLSQGWSLDIAAELSNIAAGMSLEHVGCQSVDLSDLSKRLLKNHLTSKVFEDEYLFALKQILSKRPFTLLKIEKDSVFTSALFEALLHLANPDLELVLFLEKKDDELVTILNAINEVDTIILSECNVKNLLSALHPKQTYVFEECRLTLLDKAEKLFVS
jgi:D-beta-D-heptose 7-phosphate kinase/D-beta-D-heptose 1-phosphate adenosyltransferase